MDALVTTKIPGVKKLFSGKVRDVYSVDREHLIISYRQTGFQLSITYFPTESPERESSSTGYRTGGFPR